LNVPFSKAWPPGKTGDRHRFQTAEIGVSPRFSRSSAAGEKDILPPFFTFTFKRSTRR
jgi:hypothetical protein